MKYKWELISETDTLITYRIHTDSGSYTLNKQKCTWPTGSIFIPYIQVLDTPIISNTVISSSRKIDSKFYGKLNGKQK